MLNNEFSKLTKVVEWREKLEKIQLKILITIIFVVLKLKFDFVNDEVIVIFYYDSGECSINGKNPFSFREMKKVFFFSFSLYLSFVH